MIDYDKSPSNWERHQVHYLPVLRCYPVGNYDTPDIDDISGVS